MKKIQFENFEHTNTFFAWKMTYLESKGSRVVDKFHMKILWMKNLRQTKSQTSKKMMTSNFKETSQHSSLSSHVLLESKYLQNS